LFLGRRNGKKGPEWMFGIIKNKIVFMRDIK